MLRGRQKREDPEANTTGPAAPDPVIAVPRVEPSSDILRDGPLLVAWFIVYELDKELRRASRHERPLSIMVLTPTPTLGREASEDARLLAAAAAQEGARSTDLIGWLEGGRILVIMPETDRDGAASAVHRWRDKMYARTLRSGAVRWRVEISVNPWEHESAEALLATLANKARPAAAA
jgi:GGDEF domain-containing protein